MADQWNTAKDMLVLLAVIHISKIDLNLDVAERIVAGWPAEMGKVPADANGILHRIDEIWQKSVCSVVPSTPAVLPTHAPAIVRKESNGSCSTGVIIIDDDNDADTQNTPTPTCRPSPLPRKPRDQTTGFTPCRKTKRFATDDDDKDKAEAPNAPAPARPLPRTFRQPPGASLVTPRSSKKRYTAAPAATPKRSTVVIDSGKGDGEKKPTKNGTLEKHDTTLPTPKSIERHIASKANKTRMPRKKPKLGIPTTRKAEETHDDHEADEDTIKTPSTLGGTRKRRRIDYTAVHTDWHDKNDSDSDYEFEEVEDDERLDAMYDKSCPIITPSKPQRKR